MVDFDEYIRQGEPQQREKGHAWQTAIGLQAVDGLKTSEYLLQTAQKHIEGDITIEEAKQLVDSYYQSKTVRAKDSERTEEADKVSARITEILSEKSFNFSPVEYITIHKRLFKDIYKFAGSIREYNITKKEWVLRGETVTYGNAANLRETLDYDFAQEKKFSYRGVSRQETISHLIKFVADLWQIHPFGEGNTRTTALFTIKYLRTLGIDYLELFFRNLLMNETNELKNRNLLINIADYVGEDKDVRVNVHVNVRVNSTKREGEIIELIESDNNITILQLANALHVNERTIRRDIINLKEHGVLTRIGADKNGVWSILKDRTNFE